MLGVPGPTEEDVLIAPVVVEPELSPAEKEARRKELHRQRQARYEARKKAESAQVLGLSDVDLSSDNDTSGQGVPLTGDDGPLFRLKNPFKRDAVPDAKLFTKSEAEDALERLTDVYFRASGLLDEILEAVVKDHEPVTIWQLEQDEAELFARRHLERAKHDKGAARSARQLLSLYDRLHMWLWALPRGMATQKYIKKHGGLSFR